jgi:hypothetical protein
VVNSFEQLNSLQMPLGMGSGTTHEAGGIASLQELRPMAFLDGLYVLFSNTTLPDTGITATSDAFFLLEY